MKTKMQELINKLNEASAAYYEGNNEIMSNAEWDAMFDELKSLEETSGIILPNSPTHNVGSAGTEAASDYSEVLHEYPALSLDKTKKWKI